MTCKEKLKIEHPDIYNEYPFQTGCPSNYGYLDDPKYCTSGDDCCEKCWDRKIPEPDASNDECPTEEERISECHPTIKDSSVVSGHVSISLS